MSPLSEELRNGVWYVDKFDISDEDRINDLMGRAANRIDELEAAIRLLLPKERS